MIEEYKTLRMEILDYLRAITETYLLLVTAAAALFGYALITTTDDSLLRQLALLSPLIVLVPGLYMILARLDSVYGIGAYIRERLEPSLSGLGWEAAWYQANSKQPVEHRIALNRMGTLTAIQWTFHGLEYLSAGLFAAQWRGPVWVIGIVGGILLAHTLHAVVVGRNATNSEKHGRRWRQDSDQPNSSPDVDRA
jgi:hypothetical protein